MGYTNQKGVLVGTAYKRYNALGISGIRLQISCGSIL